MPLGKRQRKILLVLCFGLAGIILLWSSCPLWFPWVLRPVAARFGASYHSYARNGYGGIVFQQITFTNEDIKINATQVESVAPTLWLWRRTFGNNRAPVFQVKGWQLELNSPGSGSSPSIPEIVDQTSAILHASKSWIPAATLSDGAILLPGVTFKVPSAVWTAGALHVPKFFVNIPGLDQILARSSLGELTNLTLTSSLGGPQPWQIRVKCEPLRLESAIKISTNALGIGVQSTVSWPGNQVSWDAQFGSQRLLPEKATFQATELHFRGEQLQLNDYSEVNSAVTARWNGVHFLIDANASALPSQPGTNFPPFKVDFHASGDTNSATVHSAAISSPWFTAQLSEDFTLFFSGQLVRAPATASLSLDFTKQPWLPLQGVLRGEARISPGKEKFPSAEFHLKGSNFGNSNLLTSVLETGGTFTWPRLEITQAAASFEDGSSITARAKVDFEKKEITGADLDLNGGLLQRWLPSGYSYAGLHLTTLAHGPFQSLQHSGRLVITNFTSPQFSPLQLQVDWSGTQTNLDPVSLSLSARSSSLAFQGSLAIGTFGTNLTLQSVTLTKSNQPMLTLTKPLVISLNHDSSNASLLSVDSFNWQGRAGAVQASAILDWPAWGYFNASATNIRSGLADDFLKSPLEPFEIHSFKAVGGWTNGPLEFTVDGSGSTDAQKDLPLAALLNLRGNSQGITISNLVVSSQTSSVAIAQGFLPVSFEPGATTNRFHINVREDFNLVASTEPQSLFWEKVAAWSGLRMVAPNLQLNVSGTLQAPQGVIQFQASQIRLRNAVTNIPPLDDIDLEVVLDRQTARIKECNCLVQGQPLRLTGEIPLGESFWSQEVSLPDWKAAHGHLSIQNAQLAAFTPMFPQMLSPQGELNLDVEMQPGPRFEGSLRIRHGRTRPLAALGPIRDIEVNLKLHEHSVLLNSATANIGGAAVFANGRAELAGMDWLKPRVPPFSFVLRGTNVPLARQPESIIRSDLDVTVTKTNDSPALVSGKAHLRDSFFLHDLADLVPKRVNNPSRRPPYFSVEAEPLADWRLAVQVTGERFLKVRSTVFNGQVSANLNVQGTLKEPLALGDVRVDSGLVRFPFANLKVQQGFVTLTSQDPYRPHLTVSAVSRQYGYDIKMEVSGPVDAPILQFSSTPPLTSEQILLMVTAGDLPHEERSLSTQQRAETLALFVGKDLLTKLGFGDQQDQKLTIHSGEQLSDQGRPTYTVEYELTDRWSLVGEYDRFNAFNAGLKWRIFSK